MANENTQDLAVLGFRVETKNAETALQKIEDKIRGLDSAINITDKLLAEKVQKALTPFNDVRDTIAEIVTSESKLSKAVGSIKDLAETVQGMNNLGEVAKNMKAAFTELDTKYVTKLTQKFINMSKAFNGTAMTLDVAVKVTNPDELDALSKKLLIGIDPTAETQINALNSTLTSIKNGLSINIKIPDKSELETWAANVDKVVQPEIKFDQKANTIVQNLYTTIRGKIAERGSILVPLQFTFGKPKLDMPDTQITDAVKRGRDALRDTLLENVKDFGGNVQFEKLWEKAILGGPKSIEKIRKVLETRTSWLEEGIEESMKAAALSPSKYGELIEQGMGSIPVEVANAMDKITSQAQHLLEPLQNKLIVRPEVGVAKQSDTEIQKIFNDFSAHVGELASKSLKKVIATAEKVVIQPKSAVVDTAYLQAAVGIVTATKTVTASADVILDPFSIKVKTDNLGPESIKLTRKGLRVDTITFEPDKINFRGLDKIANVLANPVGVNADLKVKPNTVSIDEEALNKLLPLKYAVKPIDVKAKIKVAPTAATVDSEAAKQIVGTSKTAIKVQAKIDVDPLPSDEIEKMGLLVTQINNVDVAYGQLLGTVRTLRDTVRETETAMSKELRGLIRGEQHKAEAKIKDPEKAAAADAERVRKKAEAAQKELEKLIAAQEKEEEEIRAGQALAELLTSPVDMEPSKKRNEEWAKQREEWTKLEEGAGKFAENVKAQQKDIDKVKQDFTEGQQQIEAAIQKTAKEAESETKKVRENAKAWLENSKVAANARVEQMALERTLQRIGWRIDNLPRVEPTKLIDPFIKLKAEIGEANSRLVDIGRTLGIYFSGRSIINMFKQAAESANAFGMEIRRIQSLATDFDFTNLRNELMDIDARFGNVIHNSQALYWAYSSGVRGTESELAKFVEVMSKTATTIKADIMPTVDAATSIMNAWNLSASSAAEIGDLLFSIVKYGKSNAQQLTTSLGHVVAPAAALNVQLNELGAAAAVLTKTMKTNRAFTYLSNILGKLASPTKNVQEAAAELGIELSASAIKARGFAQTLRDIREATGGDVGKIAKLFPDLRGQRAAITLLSTQYADFEKQLDNMTNKAGSMEEALGKITDTPESQLRALRNTWSMISINAGDAVNNVLTLGGALGPLLKTVNGLEHGSREILGHLVAAGGAIAGIAVSAKVLAAARYASVQASYQMASADMESRRVAMDNAMFEEQRAVESMNVLKANMQQNVVQKKLNDEVLRELRNKKDILDTTLRTAQIELKANQTNAKFLNENIKMQFNERLAATSNKQNRVSSLQSWLVKLTTGEGQQNIRKAANLIERLQKDIEADTASIQGQQGDLVRSYTARLQPLIEANAELKDEFNKALAAGDIGTAKNADSFMGRIASFIKRDEIISQQMARFDTNGQLLERETRRILLATKGKELIADENYQHSLLIQFVKDELAIAKDKLQTEQNNLRNIIAQNGVTEEAKAMMTSIAEQTLAIQQWETERVALVNQINDRTRELTGRESDQVILLDAAAKLAKELLAEHVKDFEQLKKNVDVELRIAANIGPKTLAATKASTAAKLEEYTIAMRINTLEAERNTLIDKQGRYINETKEAQERVMQIDKEKNELLVKRNALEKEFLQLGIRAGDQEAIKTKIVKMAAEGSSLSATVDALARDKGVVTEAVKAMSSEIGKGIFGGKLGGRGMQGLSMLAPFIPGLGKWGMGISMLTSFDVFGKAASGMTRLTSEVYRLLGTTEQLQKKGLFPMEKGVEDLTKNVMLSTVSIKGMVASLTGLKALGWAGGSKAFLAALTGPTGIASIVGVSLIGAIAGTLGYAFSQSEKGGPLGDVMEKLFGIEDLKRYSELLDARRERMQTERETHESMVRETQRMLKIQEEQNSTIKRSLVWQRETNALRQALVDLSVYDEIQMKELELFNKRAKRQRMQEQRKGVLGAMQSSPFAALELNKLDAEMPSKAEIDELANATKELYRKYWAGVGETAYQQLRESLEADRDAAFTPMMDANGKMDLANKMATMAEKRLSSLLGYDDETLDLTMKSSLQIREMIRKRIAELKKSAEDAHIALEDAKEQANMYAEGSPERTKADETVKQLELAYEAAAKKLDDDATNITNAFRDYYNKIANKANAFVEQLKENSGNQQKMAKFNALFTQNDESFNVLGDTIVDYWDAMNKLRTDYANKAGVFKGMDADAAQIAFKDALKKLGDQQIQNITTNVNNIKQMQDNLTRFMETQANDMRQLSKQQFEYNMANPALAGKRSQLIKNRMKELDSIMQPIIQQRDAAFMKAQELMNQPGQMARAQESLEEAYKFENQVKGLAQEELELVKKRADIERGINASMYQLASTLQGKFESTAQTAVDAYSVESIRLQMRQIGENIAPPVQTSAQAIERKLTAQLFQRSIDNYNLLQQASLRLQQQISNQAQNADKMGNAAVTIQRASDTAKVAAETFKRTVESNRTTFRVKRI